jgi:uncharacterized protein (TIGR03435 family)
MRQRAYNPRMLPARVVAAALAATAIILGASNAVHACTAFCARGNGHVLVGNNEDWNNPHTRIWFEPAEPGKFGRMFSGFDDQWPQGGMNERGLWFDGFATPAIGPGGSPRLPSYRGHIVVDAMAQCATVDDVVALFSRYDRSFLAEGVLMFADASGDAVSIERNAIVRKSGRHFVQTNFHQSLRTSIPDRRFTTASQMLDEARGNISVDLFRRILAATHQNGAYPTLYSNVYDLTSRKMHLYYFHDFDRVVTFDLAEELKKGKHTLDIPALFPRKAEADAFAAKAAGPTTPSWAFPALVAGGIVGVLFVIAVGVLTWLRGGRATRIGISIAAAVGLIAVVSSVLLIDTHRAPDPAWLRFAISPPTGDSVSIGPNKIVATGMTLNGAIAFANDFPPVRVIAPEWLKETRYSLDAMVSVESAEPLRAVLKRELDALLRLETHVEIRPFDVLVLSAGAAPRLDASRVSGPSTSISKTDVTMQAVSMADLASAVQSIVGKPVIDETGIAGTYDMAFAWGADRVASVSTVLRDRFDLRLAPAQRNLEALVVDNVRREPALVLASGIGWLTRAAPPYVRTQVARAFLLN